MTHPQRPGLVLAVATLVAVFSAATPARGEKEEPLLVYAAASMTNVVDEIMDVCGQNESETTRTSFAASSVLAKQIDHGAPAALFVSANSAWMDYLERRGRIAEGTRHRIAGNTLAFVAPTSSPTPSHRAVADLIAALPADGRIAMGDPDHVPAGVYAKAALEHISAWEGISKRVARTANVRAALALVETGAVFLGIVYKTDALVSENVRMVAVFPRDSHPAISYEAALVRGRDTPAAHRLLTCVHGAETARVFERHGFLLSAVTENADAH